jgi:ribosomal protein S18 acetylase RimI-like enzyme
MFDIKQQAVTKDLNQRVYEGFSQYATAVIGRPGVQAPIAFVATDENTFAGVVIVELLWGALHVKYLYVEEIYRGNGLGTRLMEQAHEFGRQHGCSFICVETMSYFHTLEFYQKLGYYIEFIREGYAEGISLYCLQKKLSV